MLKLESEITPAPIPGVRAFPDDTRAGVFCLLPNAPAIARDDTGRAEFSFIAFGRKQDGGFRGEGGLLTFTTTLQLTPALREQARRALESRLGRDLPAAAGVELGAFDWLDGTVTVSLTAHTQLTGRPSMTGGNACAFNVRLNADAASAFTEAMAGGLRDARIRYDMQVRAAGSPAGAPVTAEGGLGLQGDDLRSLAQ